MAFEVETQVYNGPFDLLLHLILAEEVELYEISLATIVDTYLAELEKMESLCLLYTSPSPRDQRGSRMPSSA